MSQYEFQREIALAWLQGGMVAANNEK